MPTCKMCGSELTERPQKSKRPGETLFVCPACGSKWQGRLIVGYWHTYKTGRKNVLAKTAQVNIREYQQVLDAIRAAGYGPLDVWSAGKRALDIRVAA